MMCWASFHMPVAHWCIFFREMSIKLFAHFLSGLVGFLPLSCRSSLYILEINLLLDIWVAKFFSHSVVYLSTLVIISICFTDFSFMLSYLSIFTPNACAFWCHIKKMFARANVMKFSLLCFYIRVLEKQKQ